MMAMKPKENSGNKTKGFDFYNYLIVLKENFGRDSITNCCVIRRIYI